MKYIIECEKKIKCIYVVDAENDEQCHEKLASGQFDRKFEFDDTQGNGYNYGGYYYKRVEAYSGDGDQTVICSIDDLCKYLNTTPDRIKRDMFKYTECGTPIEWDDEKVTLAVYAEGADGGYSHDLFFPFTGKEFDKLVERVDKESDELWHMWNDEEEGE